jgi:hypothetical protein
VAKPQIPKNDVKDRKQAFTVTRDMRLSAGQSRCGTTFRVCLSQANEFEVNVHDAVGAFTSRNMMQGLTCMVPE